MPNEEPKPKTKADLFFDDIAQPLQYLYSRWQDEKEYEPIEDYAKPLQPHAEKHGVTIGKMSKRPFGFTFSVDGKTYKADCNSRTMGYKRIA